MSQASQRPGTVRPFSILLRDPHARVSRRSHRAVTGGTARSQSTPQSIITPATAVKDQHRGMPAVAPGARLDLAAGAEEYEFHREISRWECRAIETTSFGSGRGYSNVMALHYNSRRQFCSSQQSNLPQGRVRRK